MCYPPWHRVNGPEKTSASLWPSEVGFEARGIPWAAVRVPEASPSPESENGQQRQNGPASLVSFYEEHKITWL